jgi:hypothetical protein
MSVIPTTGSRGRRISEAGSWTSNPVWKITEVKRAVSVAQVVEHWPCKHLRPWGPQKKSFFCILLL